MVRARGRRQPLSTPFLDFIECPGGHTVAASRYCPRCGAHLLDDLCDRTLDKGKIEIMYRLGKGGFGTVYRAFHADRGKVAVKVIHPKFADDPRVISRFRTELRANFRFSHRNKPKAIASGREERVGEDGRARTIHWFAMEYCPGLPLETVLKQLREKEELLDLAQVVDLMDQVLRVVAEAHSYGVCHRDLHPNNIQVEFGAVGEIHAKVLDFGIAQIVHGENGSGKTVIGRDNWMSPEQMKGLEVDQRTDIFNLGLLLYVLLTGRHPFFDSDTGEFHPPELSPAPPPPSETGSWPKPALKRFDSIIRKALQTVPDKRFANAEVFRQKLSRTLKPRRRGRMYLLVFLLLLVLGVVAMAIWFPGLLTELLTRLWLDRELTGSSGGLVVSLATRRIDSGKP